VVRGYTKAVQINGSDTDLGARIASLGEGQPLPHCDAVFLATESGITIFVWSGNGDR